MKRTGKGGSKSSNPGGGRRKSTSSQGGTSRSGGPKRKKKVARKKTARRGTGSSTSRAPARKPRAAGSKPPAQRRSSAGSHPEGDRLQKVLAAAGIASRRECEEWILAGRVEVDRKMVTELGVRVDPSKQEIRVDGTKLQVHRPEYYAVNKPKGVVSTASDPSGRRRVVDLVEDTRARLFPVGRLDMNSEGLILLTNDGELANRLTHPRYEIPKVYRVQVAGIPDRETLAQLRKGVYIAEGLTRVEKVKIQSKQKQSAVLEMVLTEGKNREIRRVLAKLGHKVMQLVRVAVGPIRLGKLASGEYRRLTPDEIASLMQLVDR